MNTSCIKGIKASYKVKLGSKSRMRGMSEYQEAEREVEREAMRETSRTGVALMSEPVVGAAEEQPIQRGSTLCVQASSSLCFPRRAQPEEGQKRI